VAEVLVAQNPTRVRGHHSVQSRLKSEFFTDDKLKSK
jgi:hypothetical protein